MADHPYFIKIDSQGRTGQFHEHSDCEFAFHELLHILIHVRQTTCRTYFLRCRSVANIGKLPSLPHIATGASHRLFSNRHGDSALGLDITLVSIFFML